MFTLESPRRGDSNEYTQYTIFNMNKKNTLNYPKSAAMGFFSKGLKNEFETDVVNEPSVFEPFKFHCIPNDSNISINCSATDYSSSETSSKKSSIYFCDEEFDQFMLRIQHSIKKDKTVTIRIVRCYSVVFGSR